MTCTKCYQSFGGFFDSLNANLSGPNLCPKCRGEEQSRLYKAELRQQEVAELAESVTLTTTHGIDGFRVESYLGIESVEVVIGTGMFTEMGGSIADFLGRRSKGFEGKLQRAKQIAFESLKMIAAKKGANAVIGIDLDYTEFSGNRVGLILNGTLVRIVPKSQAGEIS